MPQHRTAITIKALNPVIGAELHGVDLRQDLPEEDIRAIKEALDRYQVVFFRDQDLSAEQHLKFGRRFGELHVHPSVRGKPRDQWSEIMPVHADANTARIAGDKWHTDVSCDEKPPLASILHMTAVPESGGDTLFSSMYAAYDALSDPMKRLLQGLTATHDGAPNYDDRAKRSRENNPDRVNPVAVHPVIANATAEPVKDAARARRLLADQLTAPVRWVDCMKRAAEHAGAGAQFIEVGPGAVLAGLAVGAIGI